MYTCVDIQRHGGAAYLMPPEYLYGAAAVLVFDFHAWPVAMMPLAPVYLVVFSPIGIRM